MKIASLLTPITLSMPHRLTNIRSWHGHMPFAFWCMEMLKPELFVELGTHQGDSYCAFCQAVSELELATSCFAVDTWVGDQHAGIYGESTFTELLQYNTEHYGAFSRLIRSTFDEAADYFADGSIDLLHIDGLHTYDAIRHDFETYQPKLSRRGVVLLHDINVRENEFGVWRFWDELCTQYPHFSFLHGFGLGVLVVGDEVPQPIKSLCSLSEAEIHEARKVFARLGNVAEASSQRDALVDQIADLDSRLVRCKGEISGLQQQNAGLRAELRSVRSDFTDQIQQRNKQIESLQFDLSAVYHSTSWKVTGPLRFLMNAVYGLASHAQRSGTRK